MTITKQHVLDSFDLLSIAEQQAVACEILRRLRDADLPPLADEELVLSAEAFFLALDRQEATEACNTTG